MSKIKQMLTNPRSGEFIRFVLVGGFVTIVGIINFAILNIFFNYNLAYVFACIIGLSLQFILQNYVVFKTKTKASKAPGFAGVYIFQFLVVWVALYVGISLLGWLDIIAYIVANAIGVPITFFLNRLVLVGKI